MWSVGQNPTRQVNDKPTGLPDRNPQFYHHTELEEGNHPPLGPTYSTSEAEAKALQDFLEKNLKRGHIRQSQSPLGAPVLFVKKKDGSLRLRVDWRGLNAVAKKEPNPLPLIPNILDRVRSSKVFTKIHLRGAYNNLRISPGDEWKTAFHTQYGSFEFLVMQYGLANAPASYERFMKLVFADILDKFAVVHLNDILIFSTNSDEHKDNVREVLTCLRKHKLYANADKCEFSVDTTEFLGFVISPSGISMPQSKVDAVLEWPTPKTVKQIQTFLGFAKFYRHFIVNYSDIVVPLTRLTRKGAPWDWPNEADAAFNSLKKSLTEPPVLTRWLAER